MKFYFSNETRGFYIDDLHSQMPRDVIALQDGEHQRALDWQAKGGIISGVNADGSMILDGVPSEAPNQMQNASD